MEKNNCCHTAHSTLVLPALIMAAALLLCVVVGVRGLERIKLASQVISVKGFSQREITADLGIWRGSFSVVGASLTGTYGSMEADKKKVLSYLKTFGIPDSEVDVGAIFTTTNYKTNDSGYSSGEIESYLLTQTVTVQSADVNRLERLSKESTQLIKEGVGFTSNTPEFLYTKLEDLKISLLGDATKDAKNRAQEMARASGNSVGNLRGARQGVFQITPLNSTNVSDYGEYDTSSIQKAVKAVVTVDYSVE